MLSNPRGIEIHAQIDKFFMTSKLFRDLAIKDVEILLFRIK